MNHRYFTALAEVGAAPVMLPLLEDEAALRGIFENLDGVFLAGGVDVDPGSYNEEQLPLCGRTDPARDRVEIRLARWASEQGKPLLGVCRGMQIMNVAAGGSLYQDCAQWFPGAIKHDYFPTAGHARDYLAHEVKISSGSRLHDLFARDAMLVNSMHHQVLKDVPDTLATTAVAPDGVVEALEARGDAFYLGVQWHPEMLLDKDAGTRRMFEEFVAAAAASRLARSW
jgi:putative glutamine amidotransferase